MACRRVGQVERGDRMTAVVDRRDHGPRRAKVDTESQGCSLPQPSRVGHSLASRARRRSPGVARRDALLWWGVDRAPTRWIRTADQLDDLVDDLAGCRALGLDTEADSLHHYTEKVCLIQLAAFGGGSWLVDPLALRDLSPLGQILGDESVVVVVHGGDNDVSSLRRDFGFAFRTMFDTSIA